MKTCKNKNTGMLAHQHERLQSGSSLEDATEVNANLAGNGNGLRNILLGLGTGLLTGVVVNVGSHLITRKLPKPQPTLASFVGLSQAQIENFLQDMAPNIRAGIKRESKPEA